MATVTDLKEGDVKAQNDAKANEEAVKKKVDEIAKMEQSYRDLLKTKESAYVDYVRATEVNLKTAEKLADKDSKHRTGADLDELAKVKDDRDEKFRKHNNALEDCFRSLGELFATKVGFYEQVINGQNSRINEYETQKKAQSQSQHEPQN